MKRPATREELQQGRFVLLLDGLDEVMADDGRREHCVLAINDFMQTAPCGLVVCSRIGDYQTLQNQLAVVQALVLQPLGNRQIEVFINQVDSPRRAAMQAAIKADWQLREALRSPLLLNLYPQAFAAMPALAEPMDSIMETVEARRQTLFAAYVETVFDRPASDDRLAQTSRSNQSFVTKKKSIGWLSFLASQMQEVGSSIFYVEELQPTWLPEKLIGLYRATYGLLHGLIVGLLAGLIYGLLIGQVFDVYHGIIANLLFGLIGAIGGGLITWLTTPIKRDWLRSGLGGLFFGLLFTSILGLIAVKMYQLNSYLLVPLIIGLVSSLIIGIIIGLTDGLREGGVIMLLLGLSIGLGFVLVGGLGLIISSCLACWFIHIHLWELIKPMWPDWQRIRRFFGGGVYYGAIGGFILGVIAGVFISGVWIGLLVGGILGAIFGLIGGSFGMLFAFFDSPRIYEHLKPTDGARISLRNALILTLSTTLLIIKLSLIIWSRFEGVELEYLTALSFFMLLNILPPTFTWFGGLAWCQHWALRFMLARRRWLPWRLVPWLDEMVARGLLRRVGGGYIFIHRSLLEYFAALADNNE